MPGGWWSHADLYTVEEVGSTPTASTKQNTVTGWSGAIPAKESLIGSSPIHGAKQWGCRINDYGSTTG